MKRLRLLLSGLVLLLVTAHANAWFFIFFPLPGVFNGNKGSICIKDGIEEGQEIVSISGNTAKVIATHGTSRYCKNPLVPIRSELEFTNILSSKAKIALPDDFETKSLEILERFDGLILKAISKTMANHGAVISIFHKSANLDLQGIANDIEKRAQGALSHPNEVTYEGISQTGSKMKDVIAEHPETLTIHGHSAVRFELKGTIEGIFGKQITELYTVIEDKESFMVIKVYIPSELYAVNQENMKQISETAAGLQTNETIQ